MRIFLILLLLTATIYQCRTLPSQSPQSDESTPQQEGPLAVSADRESDATEPAETLSTKLMRNLHVPLKTAGGTQLWTDRIWREGYRIQKNALTGHCRLVDATDVRRVSGSRALCEATLKQLLKDKEPAESATDGSGKHVVVLLHGLMRTHHSMKPLSASLREAGYDEVVRFSYASTRGSIGDHAAALREVLDGFPPDTRFSFVGHSMGNIVVRHLIGDLQRDRDPAALLPRCQAMVMLGPPNQGAAIARRLAATRVFGFVTGQGGLELGPQWDEFAAKLGTPPFPFAIVAGDVSDARLSNPLVDGTGDFIVSLEEAGLDGAVEFHSVPTLHSFLMSDEAAMRLAVGFLQSHAPPGENAPLLR
jgi:pimeloyl-ACP methyl ester carboxylesterase